MGIQLFSGAEVAVPYYWYLDFMLFWYVVFYLLITIPKMYERRYLVLSVISVITFAFCSIIGNGLRAEQAVSFLIGVWLSDNYEKARKWLTNPAVLIALLLVGTALLMMKQIPAIRTQEGGVAWQGIQLVMKTSFAMAFIGGTYLLRKAFNNGFIVFVSGISYELYLVHFRLLSFPPKGFWGMCLFCGLSLLGAWMINQATSGLKKKLCSN